MMAIHTPFIILSTSIMIVSSLMAMSSTNWMFLWAALELNLLSFMPILMNSKTFQETEAAVKYFLVQALGSSVLLMSSLSLWYLFSTPNNMMYLILLMSLILKMGMAPCHMWFPSVMTSISWLAALVLSTWQKLAPLFIVSFLMAESSLCSTMMALASINAITGGLMGMNQSHLRTIMAYSSITHMGWMMSLIALSKPIYTMWYFALYSIIITPFFIMMYTKNITNTNSISMVSCSYFTQFSVPMLLLSLSGLPPLTGFFPKWMTISMLVPSHPMVSILLISGAMMNSYFYLNIAFNFMMNMEVTLFTKKDNWVWPKKYFMLPYRAPGLLLLMSMPAFFI